MNEQVAYAHDIALRNGFLDSGHVETTLRHSPGQATWDKRRMTKSLPHKSRLEGPHQFRAVQPGTFLTK